MSNLDLHWRSNSAWWHFEDTDDPDNEAGVVIVLNNDAPEEAKKSYQHYLQQKADFAKRYPNAV